MKTLNVKENYPAIYWVVTTNLNLSRLCVYTGLSLSMATLLFNDFIFNFYMEFSIS
jgi:hypothetical protein